mgnify:CR=1 FL=1
MKRPLGTIALTIAAALMIIAYDSSSPWQAGLAGLAGVCFYIHELLWRGNESGSKRSKS